MGQLTPIQAQRHLDELEAVRDGLIANEQHADVVLARATGVYALAATMAPALIEIDPDRAADTERMVAAREQKLVDVWADHEAFPDMLELLDPAIADLHRYVADNAPRRQHDDSTTRHAR